MNTSTDRATPHDSLWLGVSNRRNLWFMEIVRFTVTGEESMRLDRALIAHGAIDSRRAARELVASGHVRVNGRPVRKGALVQPGDDVDVTTSDPEGQMPTPQPELSLAVLYVDDTLVAIDKPAGLPSVALHPTDRDTLANALLGHFSDLASASLDPLEAGVVHRLDTPTSGIVLAARTRAAWEALRAQFQQRTVVKEYLALAAGAVGEPGVVRLPIAHRPRRPREMCACANAERARALAARSAETVYRPLQQFAGTTLLEVGIRTGVRHQIRVHLDAIGHPIVGEELYGRGRAVGAARLMLHATRLQVRHPVTGRELIIESPPGEDFRHALRQLSASARRRRPGRGGPV